MRVPQMEAHLIQNVIDQLSSHKCSFYAKVIDKHGNSADYILNYWKLYMCVCAINSENISRNEHSFGLFWRFWI